jgi:hypothetical protein
MLFVRSLSRNGKVKTISISKNAVNIKLECDPMDQTKGILTYQVSGGSFTMTQFDETRFPAGSEIALIKPPFNIFIMGDLSYYAYVLGMPNSTSHWCPWCLLSHPEWNKPPETFTIEARKLTFLLEMYLSVKSDVDKRLKPQDKKGVTCERHYKCLGPDNFVPPLLHLEIGMVNHVRDEFEEWVDNVVEVVPPIEKDA